MNPSFKVEKLSFLSISELPNAWHKQNYIDLLQQMDFGDTAEIPEEELKEMCLMVLADNNPEDAAKIVLEYFFKDRLTKGQIDNLSNEMLDEKMWEEYADLSLHEEFFNVNQLLYEAFNGKFPHPKAVKFKVKITAKSKSKLAVFNYSPDATLLRLFVAGMPENTLIFRLFEEQVVGDSFKDAKDIIWQLKIDEVNENQFLAEVISSSYWFHDFKYITEFEAETHADESLVL